MSHYSSLWLEHTQVAALLTLQAAMDATKKILWPTPSIMQAAIDSNNHDGASVTSRRSGSKGKREDLGECNQMTKDEDGEAQPTREQKMTVGQHYSCAAYYDTGCQAQWSGSHPWWAHGTRNGKNVFICSECQFKLYGWITRPSQDTQRILKASSSSSQGAKVIEAADVPVPMDVDDDDL